MRQDPAWILLPLALLNLAEAGPRARPLKIFIMAGQSNAVGHGSNTFLETNAPELLKPRDDVWYYQAGRVPSPLGPGRCAQSKPVRARRETSSYTCPSATLPYRTSLVVFPRY